MTSAEMYQEGQVLLDKVDSQDLPEIQPEQFLIFVNVAVDELMQAARIEFEKNSKVRDDISTHVQTLYILPEITDNQPTFSFKRASLVRNPTDEDVFTDVFYLLSGYFESSIGEGENKKEGKTRYSYIQQDDLQPALADPFNKPKYADIIPVDFVNQSIIGNPPSYLTLNLFVGRFLIRPAKITQTVNCDLAEQLHHSVVKRAVELILENVESPRTQTFNK